MLSLDAPDARRDAPEALLDAPEARLCFLQDRKALGIKEPEEPDQV